MNEYEQSYIDFQDTLERCMILSKKYAGIPSPSSAHFYASLIFTKLCVSSVSALSICPTPDKIGQDAHWDCASVASLTRGIIETYLVFFYLCIDECDNSEWNARWRLMNLHDHMSRLKMFKVMDDSESEKQVALFDSATEEVKSDLKEVEFFKKISTKQQKHFLKGNTPFFQSKDEIIEASGGSVKEFRFWYRFLSNHAHSFPMGFYRMAQNGRGSGVESTSEVAYSGMCLNCVSEYLKQAENNFEKLWTEK